MIVDSSAILAVAFAEAEAEAFVRHLVDDVAPRISAANWVESTIVLERRGDPVARQRFEEAMTALRIAVTPVSVEQARLARTAFRDFGKGRHPAALNFGDCFAYALAREADQPLLFKGQDFARTDIRAALPPGAG